MYKIIQYSPKPYEGYVGNTKIELNLSGYATKGDWKGAVGVHTSNLAVKSHLAIWTLN